jgi:hypothetical protein
MRCSMQKEQQPGTGRIQQAGSIFESYGIEMSNATAGGLEAENHQQ